MSSDPSDANDAIIVDGGPLEAYCQVGGGGPGQAVQVAPQVQTANVIRTAVNQQNGQNQGIQRQWKFSLTQALPYDVLLVQQINFKASAVVTGTAHAVPSTNIYFEIIGVVRHLQTQIQSQTVDDTWFNVPVGGIENGKVSMLGQVRAFVAPPLGQMGALPARFAQTGDVPAILGKPQGAAAPQLGNFVPPQVWYQNNKLVRNRNNLVANKPFVTPGTLWSSKVFDAWKSEWIGTEVGAATLPNGNPNPDADTPSIRSDSFTVGNPNLTDQERPLNPPPAPPEWRRAVGK